MLRVKLLSKPQNTPAAKIKNTPTEKPHFPHVSDRKMLAMVIKAIAHPTLFPIASLNKTAAINAVATLSKFNSKDAVEAGVICNPNRSTMGASTPPKRIAPTNQGMSGLVNFASRVLAGSLIFKIPLSRNAPIPLPKYRNAAIGIGSMSPIRIFDKGVELANRIAAMSA